MVYAYLRCSTTKQDLENQRFAILKYADKNKFKVNEWVEETVSSRKSYKDRKLGTLLESIEQGDTLILSELSRAGRSLTEVMSILHTLMEKKAKVLTIKEKYELGDNLNSKILAFAFSLAAEVERDMISMRTTEALARLKAEGKTLGRPKGSLSSKTKLSGKEDEITELLEKGVSKSSIAKIYGVARGTMHSFIKSRKLETCH